MLARLPAAPSSAENLFGRDVADLGRSLESVGARAFHARQAYRWMHARGVLDPLQWTDLPGAVRARVAARWRVDPGRIAERAAAADGTIKYRVALPGGGAVEAVSMLQSGRMTLCLSSQVGCALDCAFCLTGKMGFGRHLSCGEIVGQAALVRADRALGNAPFHVVFMGMGEPLHNYDAVLAAFRLLVDGAGFGLSPRRITLSTSGLVPGIDRLAAEPVRPRLAVSLNATTDALRNELMPINRKYPLGELLDACRRFARSTGDGFTLEYVLLAGVNDAPADAARLARLARGLPAKVNLIPFNAVEGWLPYRAPPRAAVVAWRDRLGSHGVRATIRWSRGAEARAACGQLALLGESP